MIKDLKRIALLVWIMLTIFYGIRLYIVSKQVGMSQALQEMWDQKEKLVMENMLLENEIASKSALRYLEQKAPEAGFIKPEKIWYIK